MNGADYKLLAQGEAIGAERGEHGALVGAEADLDDAGRGGADGVAVEPCAGG